MHRHTFYGGFRFHVKVRYAERKHITISLNEDLGHRGVVKG